MDGLTRVRNAINRQPIDRIPRCDALWEDTLAEWQSQGMPRNTDPGEYFGWDIVDLFMDASIRMGNCLLANNISFWMHSCGNCEAYLEDLIECGLEVIQPLQASAGFDVRNLKPRLGARLTFFGNIDVRKMSASEKECEEEIRDKIAAAKEGYGYIYHSDHSVPPEVTFERYRCIMDRVGKYRAY
ncbi:MAG TPA: uroporphyrinogen decarboxylase family protein [Candidatus Hydrogenedentes bacterium]|nr:uroporphyrinogen decarboxylase family protein [Candidatus Hydrogenedentota bacterium]